MVGLGGGAVTDLAGFVAAAWLRGVRVVQVPTTLLGMVDAAVGGKTGINTAAGKNLVGAFHPPAGVLCDLRALATLPRARTTAPGWPRWSSAASSPTRRSSSCSSGPARPRRPAELVERAVRVKAGVVSGDLRESGEREILNYGHTLAHAIERGRRTGCGTARRWRSGWSSPPSWAGPPAGSTPRRPTGTATLLAALGLPTTYDGGAWPELHAAMRVDKKARGAVLRFVVLDGLARPAILADPDPALLAAAWAAVAAG